MNDAHAVLREKRDNVLWITINRPDKRNALNADVITGIAQGYRAAEQDPDVRVIVLTGAGDKAFCAGADLVAGNTFSFDTAEPTTEYANLLRLAHDSRVPSIARVNGACLAGGMGLLCMTDMAVCVDSAIFGLPEVRVGLFPMQVLASLKSLVSPRTLNEWCLLGDTIDAQAACRAGLVNYVVTAKNLDEKIDGLTSRLAANSPTAIRRGKYALNHLAAMSFEDGLAFAEGQIALMAMTEDAREGLASFREKRTPTWTGR